MSVFAPLNWPSGCETAHVSQHSQFSRQEDPQCNDACDAQHQGPDAARRNRLPRVCVYCVGERNHSKPTSAASAAQSAVFARFRAPSWELGVWNRPGDQSHLNDRAHRLREPGTAWWSLATCDPSSLEQSLHQNLFAACVLRKLTERSSNRTP